MAGNEIALNELVQFNVIRCDEGDLIREHVLFKPTTRVDAWVIPPGSRSSI